MLIVIPVIRKNKLNFYSVGFSLFSVIFERKIGISYLM